MSKNLEDIYKEVQQPIINERQRRIEEGKKSEVAWRKRSEEFLEKVKFLNERYGFGLYISPERETGYCSYPGQINILIRSKRTIGYISVYQDGRIHNSMCCNVDTPLMGTTYDTIEDFVKAVAKANTPR